ncbi:helix-turn-helix transcriptional regulator [Pseudomonas jilinensis]|uniref:Transcriptional regulator n=1 Tax=Pseudomonas jilinensis TaxID=2078689 RepID=A0A396SHB0_9PSED|nr:YafY family protein [Pseudomonas jilinensis]RHW23107.1 transcriptional regulator [Pseudomonas jilinensis]
MSRTTRLFELMQLLRRHRRPVSGQALARELQVSLRTLYRDIAELKAIGAQIDGEPGLGYVLKPDFMLPPLMFSGEEVEALTLGLKWVEQRADEQLASAATEVLAKVSAVLPRALNARLDDDALLVGPGWDRPQTVALTVLRQAISEERKLQLHYRDEAGNPSQRLIWPISLVFFESTRVLAAWCELRQDFRHFRTDRIEAARLLPEHYPRRRHALRQEWLATLDHTDSCPEAHC